MPEEDVALILGGAFEHRAPGGHFIQFTYGPKCPVPENVLRSLGLMATRVSGTWRNLPPASVYHIARGENRT
jgi:phospholipid N-methyltransferase